MVFDSILTGRQSSKKLIKEIMQFVNQNIEILGRGLYSPSLKDVAYLEDTQLIFLIFHTFVCKIWLSRNLKAIFSHCDPKYIYWQHLTPFIWLIRYSVYLLAYVMEKL